MRCSDCGQLGDWCDCSLATPQDAVREHTANVGRDHPEQAWILSPFDSWEKNPWYHGPQVRHPEDDHHLNDEPELAAVSASDDCPF